MDSLRQDSVGPSLPFRATPRGFDHPTGGNLSATLGALTLTSTASLGLDGTLSITLAPLTLIATGIGQQVALINRNVGPMLPFKASPRGFSFASFAATQADLSVQLGSFTLSADATVTQPPTVGLNTRQNFGPAMDFAPTPRGFTNNAATVGNAAITLGALQLTSAQGSLSINGSFSTILSLSLSSSASIGTASIGSVGVTLGAISLTSLSTVIGLFTPASVTVKAYRRGWFNNGIIEVGQTFDIASPYAFTPYWMTWVGTYPPDWAPLLEVYSEIVYAEILRPLTSAEIAVLLAEKPGPYDGK